MKIQLYSVLIITNVELPAGQSCFTHQSSFFTSASCSFSKVAIGHFLLPIFYEKINCLNQYDFFFWYILNSKNTASIFVLLTVIETRFVLQKKYLSLFATVFVQNFEQYFKREQHCEENCFKIVAVSRF